MPTDAQILWIQGTCGKMNNRVYRSFQDAKQRCTNPKNKNYKWYGARGIKFEITYPEFKKNLGT